jgi:hypothetical protein
MSTGTKNIYLLQMQNFSAKSDGHIPTHGRCSPEAAWSGFLPYAHAGVSRAVKILEITAIARIGGYHQARRQG